MTEEDSTLPPDPELVNRETRKSALVFKRVGAASILLGILAFVFILTAPIIISSPKNLTRTEAINNAKQIGLALFTFQYEYDSYPNEDTAKDIIKNHPIYRKDLSGTSSNALLLQLVVNSRNDRSEEMFYARIKNAIKPDGNSSPREALKKGEVGFAYISNLILADNSSRPIILTPMIPGTTKFDPKPFKGKAIVLHINNSVTTYDINKDGHIYDKDGDILSPNHPFWNGKTPTIHYPE